eukprot:g48395.t1
MIKCVVECLVSGFLLVRRHLIRLKNSQELGWLSRVAPADNRRTDAANGISSTDISLQYPCSSGEYKALFEIWLN